MFDCITEIVSIIFDMGSFTNLDISVFVKYFAKDDFLVSLVIRCYYFDLNFI